MQKEGHERYIVIYSHKKKKLTWSKNYATLKEAHEGIFQAKHKATGYAIYDSEILEFTKFRNFAFDEHDIDNFNPSNSF